MELAGMRGEENGKKTLKMKWYTRNWLRGADRGEEEEEEETRPIAMSRKLSVQYHIKCNYVVHTIRIRDGIVKNGVNKRRKKDVVERLKKDVKSGRRNKRPCK